MPVLCLYIARNHGRLHCLHSKRTIILPPQTSPGLDCKGEGLPCLNWTYRHCETFQSRSRSILGGRERAHVGEREILLAELLVLLRDGSVGWNPHLVSSAGA